MYTMLTSMTAASMALAPANGPLPGAETVVSTQSARWILIGEPAHGTNEMPLIAADLVSAAIARKRPIVVALEYAAKNQPSIDAYLRSNGGKPAQKAFLTAPMWDRQWADGKSSKAMFRLVEWLRTQHAAGRVSRVVAFDADMSEGGGDRERQMAASIQAIKLSTSGLVIVLTGTFHARKTRDDTRAQYQPMGALLPPSSTVSLRITANGGSSWNCWKDGCGIHLITRESDESRKLIELKPTTDGSYDGTINLGSSTTPSPPASGY